MSTTAKIRYLASCHEADNRETSLLDLFHRDVQHRHFFGGSEVLLSGLQDEVAVPTEAGLEALAAAMTYKRERSLVYAAFPVVGNWTRAGEPGRRFAAPLVTYPAALRRESASGSETVLLRASLDEPTLNFPLVDELLGASRDEKAVVESILSRYPSPPFFAEAISDLIHLFRDALPQVDADPLHGYPRLVSEREVKRRYRGSGSDEPSGLACLPAAAMALVTTPRGSRGVLFELGRIASAESISPPLRSLLGGATNENDEESETPETRFEAIPAILSQAQQRALDRARRHPLTLVVGPPGTGKSYTLSALALDHVARGRAVLIACRTEQALDVIESKLHRLLGETTPLLRGGSRDHTRELKRYLTLLLSGSFDEGASREGVAQTTKRLRRLQRHVARLERRIARRHLWEQAFGELSSRRQLRRWLDSVRSASWSGGSAERNLRGGSSASSSASTRSGSRPLLFFSRSRAERGSESS